MNRELLKDLVLNPSPSGFEFMIEGMINRWLNTAFVNGDISVERDGMNNTYIYMRKEENLPTVMISAHIDELGMQLQYKTSDNQWRFCRLGGIDLKVLEGQRVRCYTDPVSSSGWIPGVIGKKPIHLEKASDRDKSEKLEELTIDFGNPKNEPKIGDPVVVEKHYTELGSELVSAPGLDDKAGIYVVLETLDRLRDRQNDLKCNLVFVLMAQEETGLRGAKVAAKKINPNVSIDLDVSFAVDEGRSGGVVPGGSVKLGEGPIIVFGPDKDRLISETLKKVAEESCIKYQAALGAAGGTNTSAIQEWALNCRTAHIAIPQRNMHTPVEICSYKDLDACTDLLVGYILKMYN